MSTFLLWLIICCIYGNYPIVCSHILSVSLSPRIHSLVLVRSNVDCGAYKKIDYKNTFLIGNVPVLSAHELLHALSIYILLTGIRQHKYRNS